MPTPCAIYFLFTFPVYTMGPTPWFTIWISLLGIMATTCPQDNFINLVSSELLVLTRLLEHIKQSFDAKKLDYCNYRWEQLCAFVVQGVDVGHIPGELFSLLQEAWGYGS